MKCFISILLLLTLLMFAQCSVEKRLYSKGWNVQWRQKNGQKKDILEKSQIEPNNNENDAVVLTGKLKEDNLIISYKEYQKDSSSNENLKDSSAHVHRNHNEIILGFKIITETINKNINSERSTKELKNNELLTKNTDTNPLVFLWLFLIILGFVALIIALVNLTSSPSLTNLLGTLGIIIIAGFLLIILLIGLIISTSIQANKKTNENSKSSNQEKPSKTSNDKISKSEEQKKKENKNAIIFVSFVGAFVLLFFILMKA